MKIFISRSVWLELVSGKSKKQVVSVLEEKVERGDQLFTSLPVLLSVWESIDLKSNERTFFHLAQEIVSEVFTVDATIFELITLTPGSDLPKPLILEILVAYQKGMDEFLTTEPINSQDLNNLKLTLTQIF